MGKVRFKPNKPAAEALLKGPEVQALLARTALVVASRAGEGFTSGVRVGKDRARAYVLPGTYKARRKQARDHALERAAGRSQL